MRSKKYMAKKEKNVSDEEVVKVEVSVSEEVVIDAVDVSFDDQQLAKILEAGLEPAQVRNEIGLCKVHGKDKITLTEAIKRAVTKYLTPKEEPKSEEKA